MQAWEETVDYNNAKPEGKPEPAYPKEVCHVFYICNIISFSMEDVL